MCFGGPFTPFTEWGEQTSFPHTGAFGCYDIWWLLALIVLIDYQRFRMSWCIRAVHLEMKLNRPANLKMLGMLRGE